ncbi:MAG TPA: NAD+ synthase [Planctomycetota bacterium]|nr:NAD+ synthase [Planctomycetota bacterium]
MSTTDVLRVSLAQVNVTVGDLAGNRAKVAAACDRARAAGADLVTFPELAICGYPPEDLLLRPGFLRDCRRELEALAPATKGLVAVVGAPEVDGGKVYNAAAVFADGRLSGFYRKVELPNYGVFDEKRYFTSGDRPHFLTVKGVKASVTICEDVWVPGSPVERWPAEAGAKLVVNLSASPFHAGKLAERHATLARYARATGATVFYNNLVGGQDELVFDGGALVVSPDGEVLAAARRFAEDFLVVDLTPGADGNCGLGSELTRNPQPATHNSLDEIYSALVLGTRDYLGKNGFKKAVLGLSGGIDSSLVACIAVEALGRDNVVGVTMPSQFTSSGTRSDAEVLARNLGIKFLEIPIGGVYGQYLADLAVAFGPGEPGLAGENLQARIRGNLLMALSNRFGWLVLTTGNKSEVATGYCTLYGDMAGGFAVIKDVTKKVVYELSELANQRSGKELIPRSVFDRPPTAELRPNQRDEDSLPPYRLLDPILKAYVEEDRSVEEIVAMGFDAKVVAEVARLIDVSEYKRRQAAPGVKITPKAFGRDRRIPITNRYRPG